MKASQLMQLLFTIGTVASLFPSSSVSALSFGEREVNQGQFAVVAAPYRHGYNLLILEQIPGQRPCWSETGSNPTVVDPLFLEFDFTNACIRSSDSNNYSIRFEGEDYGLDYLLNVVKKEGELHLIGTPRDSSKPELLIGQTNGFRSGSLKIQLNPGWRLTKRIYNGDTTQHIYLSRTSQQQEQLVSQSDSTKKPNEQHSSNNADSSNTNTNIQQPVTYPVQQPGTTVYQQPVTYPIQQPGTTVYQQPVTYPIQQPVTYPIQQSGTTVYQQPVTYPIQQPVTYPIQQPGTTIYQQPVTYPVTPVDVNHQEQK